MKNNPAKIIFITEYQLQREQARSKYYEEKFELPSLKQLYYEQAPRMTEWDLEKELMDHHSPMINEKYSPNSVWSMKRVKYRFTVEKFKGVHTICVLVGDEEIQRASCKHKAKAKKILQEFQAKFKNELDPILTHERNRLNTAVANGSVVLTERQQFWRELGLAI